MRIRVDDIGDVGLSLAFEEKPKNFPILSEMEKEGDGEFLAPIKVRLKVIRVSDMIEVEGNVETRVRLSCSRCLQDFETPLENRFALTYTRELPDVADAPEEGAELNADEMGLVPFRGDEINLQETIQEQVVIAFPLRPLCSQDCKGLCPQCGADLNAGTCGCRRNSFSMKFAALKDFQVKKT